MSDHHAPAPGHRRPRAPPDATPAPEPAAPEADRPPAHRPRHPAVAPSGLRALAPPGPPPRSSPPRPPSGSTPPLRALGLLVLLPVAASARPGKDPLPPLSGRWDSVWYQRIAENGYGYTVTLPNGSDPARRPGVLRPPPGALERGVSAVTPLTLAGAGLLVAWHGPSAAPPGALRRGGARDPGGGDPRTAGGG
ncbi:hypothetical protein SCALM49S_03752 [Streptomyces californicus]